MTLALLITAVTGAWAQDTYTVTFKANGNTKTVENVTLPHTFELDPIITELYPSLSGGHGSPAGTSASGNTNVTAYYNNDKHYASISASFEGAVTVTGQFFKDFTNYQYTIEINCMEKLVTISDDKTEATIKMPQYDVTVNYDIVRDMSVQMTTKVGDGADGADYRIRLKKKDDKWEPADLTVAQVMGKFKVHDAIENKDLAFYGEGAVCAISIYALDDNDQPTGNAIDFADLTPGRYVAVATAADGSAYDGSTEPSNVLVLFEGYELEIPAGEYVTYYKDENLTLDAEETDAKLYTITSVGTETATATQLQIAKAYTPILVKNTSEAKKTILLIPTEDEGDNVDYAAEFVGTLTAGQIAASTSTQTNYAFNGKQFVYVKNAIAIGANKAYLSIPATISNARTINLVFDDGTTGIEAIDNGQWSIDNGQWYDLNGRRLQGKPTKKGVYIQNGKKVVVK